MNKGATFFAACLVALAGSAIGPVLLGQEWQPFAWSVGGLLAILNALAGAQINQRAIGQDSTGFLLWGLGAHLLRALALILILALAYRFGCPESSALIVCTLFGYFVFLFHEVLGLHFVSMAAHLHGSLSARAG